LVGMSRFESDHLTVSANHAWSARLGFRQ
jgi:hypothetical protein